MKKTNKRPKVFFAFRAYKKRLEELTEQYDLLRRAVNESPDCGPGCDSYAHESDCKGRNVASWLESQQKEIERLRGIVADMGNMARDRVCTVEEAENRLCRIWGLARNAFCPPENRV